MSGTGLTYPLKSGQHACERESQSGASAATATPTTIASDQSAAVADSPVPLQPAGIPEAGREEPAVQEKLPAAASAAPAANSCVESIVAALIDDESLGRVRQNQRETLVTLNDAAERIAAITKDTADAYARNAADFVRAARVAKEIQQDLESASRRIAVVQRKLRLAREKEERLAQVAPNTASGAPAAERGIAVPNKLQKETGTVRGTPVKNATTLQTDEEERPRELSKLEEAADLLRQL